jgi:hypothetical protein
MNVNSANKDGKKGVAYEKTSVPYFLTLCLGDHHAVCMYSNSTFKKKYLF